MSNSQDFHELPYEVTPYPNSSTDSYSESFEPSKEELAKETALQLLKNTDWVEPYLIRNELGIAVLPEASYKLVIARQREEARELLKQLS
jgi:hypothetical protein